MEQTKPKLAPLEKNKNKQLQMEANHGIAAQHIETILYCRCPRHRTGNSATRRCAETVHDEIASDQTSRCCRRVVHGVVFKTLGFSPDVPACPPRAPSSFLSAPSIPIYGTTHTSFDNIQTETCPGGKWLHLGFTLAMCFVTVQPPNCRSLRGYGKGRTQLQSNRALVNNHSHDMGKKRSMRNASWNTRRLVLDV